MGYHARPRGNDGAPSGAQSQGKDPTPPLHKSRSKPSALAMTAARVVNRWGFLGPIGPPDILGVGSHLGPWAILGTEAVSSTALPVMDLNTICSREELSKTAHFRDCG